MQASTPARAILIAARDKLSRTRDGGHTRRLLEREHAHFMPHEIYVYLHSWAL